jgi:hypothetical protein
VTEDVVEEITNVNVEVIEELPKQETVEVKTKAKKASKK